MSAGGYDAPHMPSAFSRYESRRLSGNVPGSYDRPVNPPVRRRSPSPGPSHRPYDSYMPHRSDIPLRDAAPNVYRPNNYRPEYSGNYYNRSPSPDAYGPPLRGSEPEAWERGSSWRPPPPLETPNIWPERKPIPPSPTTSSARGRSSRDEVPTRIFEPSDSWKQTHVDGPPRMDHSPHSDRCYDRRGRSSLDISPDRPVRTERAPVWIPGGDRYRPAQKRDSYPSARSEYDSYRPEYDDDWTPPSRRDPISPAGSHFRRDSGSFTHARVSDRHDSPYSGKRSSRKASLSPIPVISPVHSPGWIAPDSENAPWSYPPSMDVAKREPPPRQPSRSSIASTHVTDRKSPPPPPEAHPIAGPAKTLTDANKTTPRQDLKDQTNVPKSHPNSTTNGVIEHSSIISRIETQVAPCAVPPIVKESAADVPIKLSVTSSPSNKDSCVKDTVLITKRQVSVPAISDAMKVSAVASVDLAPNGVPSPKPATPSTLASIAFERQPSQIVCEIRSKNQDAVVGIKQPKPSPIPQTLVSSKDDVLDVDIPPTTHSPSLSPDPSKTSAPNVATPIVVRDTLPNPEDIPPFSEAKTKEEALRIVVMTRLVRDRQTREERVNPVLMANLSIAAPPEVHPTATPETLIEKMYSGQCLKERLELAKAARPSLMMYVKQRQAMINNKIARLQKEYLSLHERWVAHCNALNEQQKTLASEHENQHTGRTTRRSTAITDAVRSDFEMEQIIASLGNDDATDPNHLSMRNLATIPDMISATNGQVDYLFDDTSHLVENPKEYFAPQTGIDDWTETEKAIFVDKFAAHPKQFGIIADFIPNKTAAQCVDYYYLHKNRFIDFRRVISQFAPNKRKRRGMGRKKGNGLLADIAIHDMQVKAAGSAASTSVTTRAPRGRKAVATTKTAPSSRRNAVQFEDTPTSTPTPEPESRARRRKVAAPTPTVAISALASTSTPTSAPTSAAPTPSISAPPIVHGTSLTVEDQTPEHELETRPVKRAKRTRRIKSAAMVSEEAGSPGADADKTLPPSANDVIESTSRGKKEKAAPPVIQWSEDDKNLFLTLLAQYGDDFKRIAASMPFKTTIQVTNYYKSNLVELNLARVAASAPKRSPTPEQREPWQELSFSVSDSTTSIPRSHTMPSSAGTGSTPPMSSLSYESSRGTYPPSSASSFAGRNVHSRDPVPPPWSAPLPTRTQQQPRSGYHLPSIPPPPMARLGTNNPPHENRRPSVYNLPTRNPSYPYPNPPEHRGSYNSTKYSDGPPNRHSGMSSSTNMTRSPQAQTLSPQNRTRPHPAPMYTSSPPLSNGRPGYIPPPGPASGPNATPIIHSPTIIHSPNGMSSPKLTIKPPVYGYSPHGGSPHHVSSHYPPLASPNIEPRSNSNWGSQRFYNPDGSTPYISRRRASGSSDGRGSVRRENPYPVFPNPGPASSSSSLPPAAPSSSPPASSSTGAARSNYYYHGWTP